jgi:membrane protein implicated in regulation of membrane protease activity
VNRFVGGFATASAILTAAAMAGGVWLAAGYSLAAAVPLTWLAVRYTRRRDDTPAAPRDPYAEPHVFGGREDARRTPRNRR